MKTLSLYRRGFTIVELLVVVVVATSPDTAIFNLF
jgi:prepilin-type N-terminal cleavage/methylation domain-containing protein